MCWLFGIASAALILRGAMIQKEVESPSIKEREKIANLVDSALAKIIDDWYFSVSDYYVTKEKKDKNPELAGEEELKRFHDEKGHRIKFAKAELDFTYGLRLRRDETALYIEASVNNKVEAFNYDLLAEKLQSYYRHNRQRTNSNIKALAQVPYSAIFMIPPGEKSIEIERHQDRADIIRLNFKINESYLKQLAANERELIGMIQDYCVAPLRKAYAEVYRRGKGR